MPQSPSRPVMEPIESRRLMSVTLANIGALDSRLQLEPAPPPPTSIVGSTLRLYGSAFGDVISVSQNGSTLTVNNRGFVSNHSTASITGILVRGGDGDDRITLGPGVTVGSEIKGENGNDTLVGGDNGDILVGGSGNDRCQGGLSGDYILGGTQDDHLDGQAGNDAVEGGAGNDTCLGGGGNDDLRGGAGNDRLDGGAGSDKLLGEGDHDVLIGGAGIDQLYGGDGNDLFYARDLEGDYLNGGLGTDTAYVDDPFLFGLVRDILNTLEAVHR